MATLRVFVLVFLLCLFIVVVEIECKVLQGEQSLTEIADYDSKWDMAIDPLPATKKEKTESIPPVLERINFKPKMSKREQFAVEFVDDSIHPKAQRASTSGNVKQKAIKGQVLGLLSKEEASLVDQDVNKVLEYYGYEKNNNKENSKGLGIKKTANSLNSIEHLKQTKYNLKPSLDETLEKQRLRYQQNKYQKLPGKVEKPTIFKLQLKKISNPKLDKMVNKKGYELIKQKLNRLDLHQQKNIINYSPLQENNGKPFTLKNYFVKDNSVKNGHQSSWLPIKEKGVNFFKDDNSPQFSDQNQHSNAARAAQEYMNMPSKDILKLVQNDVQVRRPNGTTGLKGSNSSKASRGGVDIAAPDWLPIKEEIHGIQFDMSQDDMNKKTSHSVQAMQNVMAKPQKNVRPNQVSGIQDDMTQKHNNGTEIHNDLSPKQNNAAWLPMKDTIHGLQFDMSRDGSNRTTSSRNEMKMNVQIKNESSLGKDSTMEEERLNATANSEFENITRIDNDMEVKNLENSVRNGDLQYGNITFKTKQHGMVSNDSEVENIHSQYKLNLTSLPNDIPKSNFKQLKNEHDVTKQIWSPEKVIHSHGHETLRMTSWGPWSTCSDTCGRNGIQIRTRQCALAQKDYLDCKGSAIDWKWCASVDVCSDSGLHIVSHNNNSTYADVVIEGNNMPRQWGSWSTCSKRCGIQSLRIRTRNCPGQRSKETGVCVEPTMQWTWCKPLPCKGPQYAPMRFGYKQQNKFSASSRILADKVNIPPNPVIHTDNGLAFHDNCVVSPWSKWSKCSKSCGENSFKFRTRTCNCDYKILCKSSTLQREHCKLKTCEGEEHYGPWSAFSPCTKPCGGGWTKRTRHCKNIKGRHLCDQDLLIGVKVCNTHKCPRPSDGMYKSDMVANVNPESMCGFNPCSQFGCMDNRESKCLADTSCDPVFFNKFGQIDDRCRGWQRYEVKDPTLFCGYDPCFGSKCQSAFGRCLVDLTCKSFVLGADGTAIDCNAIQYPF